MKNLSPEIFQFFYRLVHLGHLDHTQVRQLLERLIKSNETIALEQLSKALIQENLIPATPAEDVVSDIQKNTMPAHHSITPAFADTVKERTGLYCQYLLGKGKIGDSYLCLDDHFNPFVLKILQPEIGTQTEYVGLIKKKMELIDYKNHPNLKVHDAFYTWEKTSCFISPYIPHDSLNVFMGQTSSMEIILILNILKKICEVMKFFERIRSPYLGLHPNNIFYQPDGSVLLKDFEWNRQYFKDQQTRILISSELSYLSPEYLREETVDSLSDLYALGSLFYFLFTKRLPFRGDLKEQLLRKEKLDYTPIAEIKGNGFAYFDSMIRRLLEPQKEQRLQSFQEVLLWVEDSIAKLQSGKRDSRRILVNYAVSDDAGKSEVPVHDAQALHAKSTTASPAAEKGSKSQKTKTFLLAGVLVILVAFLLARNFLSESLPPQEQVPSEKADTPIKSQGDSLSVDKNDQIALPPLSKMDQNAQPPASLNTQNHNAVDEIEKRFYEELAEQMKGDQSPYHFAKRILAIQTIQASWKTSDLTDPSVLQTIVTRETRQVQRERLEYWGVQKKKLQKLYANQNTGELESLIQLINQETDSDSFIQEEISVWQLHPNGTPDGQKNSLTTESLLIKEKAENSAKPLIENHEYGKLVELYSHAMREEHNPAQKQFYTNEVEFYEHAEKIKDFAQNVKIKSGLLLRNLYINEDGTLEAVSSRGFHVDSNDHKIIPWKEISMRALSALVAKYEPRNLGECISLLIYASRAGNNIAMQKALRTIEFKYGAAMNSPLVKESREKLSDLRDILAEEDIRLQLGMIKILKNRNTLKAKQDAETLIQELRDEYLSTPIYKKYEAEIIDLMSSLELIK